MAREQAYHHGALREALLEAGDMVLAERGLKDFTLRECARRAGVSHSAPKHHFGDAAGFLTQIAARGFDRLRESLETRLAAARDLDEEFAETTRAYVGFAEANPEHFRIMFRCDLLHDMDETLVRAAQRTFTVLTNVIRRQRGEPEITLEELNGAFSFAALLEDTLIGWCHIHGFAHLKMERQLRIVPDQDFESLLTRTSARVGRMMRPSS
ncbi:MAG: TetR/AcrR family transcriptional regulator [Pseudomonadales bacterium]|nr:TetR/AcrR family transcriptional regulator [Pseudomonadales bacterium]